MPVSNNMAVLKSAFHSPEDNQEARPFLFDVLGPDEETSILPGNLRLMMHVNPSSLNVTYAKQIERMQTWGGFVEQHWGDAARSVSFDGVTGGFVRLYSGLSNVTGGGIDVGGTRRETIAYDKYLDLLALFHHNGSVYDSEGRIVFQGAIKLTFDEGVYIGWFQSFSATEDANRPHLFSFSVQFEINREVMSFRTVPDMLSDYDILPSRGALSQPTVSPSAEAFSGSGGLVL